MIPKKQKVLVQLPNGKRAYRSKIKVWDNVPFTFVSIRIRTVSGTLQMLNKYVLKRWWNELLPRKNNGTEIVSSQDRNSLWPPLVVINSEKVIFQGPRKINELEIVKCIEKWFIFPLTLSLGLKLRLRTPRAYFHLWVSAAWYTVIIRRPQPVLPLPEPNVF